MGIFFSIVLFLCYPIAHPRNANINTVSITIPNISLIAPPKSPCPTNSIKKPITATTARIPMIVNTRILTYNILVCIADLVCIVCYSEYHPCQMRLPPHLVVHRYVLEISLNILPYPFS